MIDQCTDAGRMMLALGALFFLLGPGPRCSVGASWGWQKLASGAAVEDAKHELRRGVTVVQALDDSRESAAHSTDLDDPQIVQAKSDPPSPLFKRRSLEPSQDAPKFQSCRRCRRGSMHGFDDGLFRLFDSFRCPSAWFVT